MYAPAFWPAAWTDACAAAMSGAREAKREAMAGLDEDAGSAGELFLDGFSCKSGSFWAVPSARFLCCASRRASMSARR